MNLKIIFTILICFASTGSVEAARYYGQAPVRGALIRMFQPRGHWGTTCCALRSMSNVQVLSSGK